MTCLRLRRQIDHRHTKRAACKRLTLWGSIQRSYKDELSFCETDQGKSRIDKADDGFRFAQPIEPMAQRRNLLAVRLF